MEDESQIFIFCAKGAVTLPLKRGGQLEPTETLEGEEDSGREHSYVRGELGRHEGVI